MNNNISEIVNEMSTKYNEDRLKWILIIKRLQRQGYEIYKKTNYEPSSEDMLEELAYESANTLEEVKELTTDNLKMICPKFITIQPTCSKCGNEIKPDRQGRIISYKNQILCHHCALSEVSNWIREEREKNDREANV